MGNNSNIKNQTAPQTLSKNELLLKTHNPNAQHNINAQHIATIQMKKIKENHKP